MKPTNNFFTPDNMMTSDSYLHDDSTFIVLGQTSNPAGKFDNSTKTKMQQALISKMINQFQRPPVQSPNKKINPFLAETKNNQDLSKFFGPTESKAGKKKKKTNKV